MSGMGPVQDWQDEEALGRLYEKIGESGFIPEQVSYDNVDRLKPLLTLEDLQCVGPYSFVERMTSYAARVIQYVGALRSLKMDMIKEKAERTGELTNEQKLYALATNSLDNTTQRQQHAKHSILHKISEILDYFTYY